jgi:biofilm PGA synthesis N-glycosyltransferase PgaC
MLTSLRGFLEMASAFAFYYPLFMSYLWMCGALFYYFHYERRGFPVLEEPPPLEDYPFVAILVPCFNEGENATEVIDALMNLKYPNYEVIAINDGSKDDTGQVLTRLAARYPRLRVVQLTQNQGKAAALNIGCCLTRAEFLVCIDGDALLDPYAVHWLMTHFESSRVGAVTGNPRVRTRSTLIGRIQVGEFSSIIGLIKRAQRTYGRVFTLSGVVACFRKNSLFDVGLWSTDMLTEDVDISWKLQTRHWDVRFEPRALCWILMPETLKGLWRQRLRWATGGTQVLRKNAWTLGSWKQRRMWPVFLEYMTSVTWAYTMAALITLGVFDLCLGIPVTETLLWPRWTGLLIGTTCLLQVAVSMLLDGRYDKGLGRHYYWMIWYPLAYWLINVATSVIAFPRALLRGKGVRARWISPDRGLRPQS